MAKKLFIPVLFCMVLYPSIYSQDKVFPGADEKTPSRSQYFSWINNTNEGSTEAQTLINLDFFKWLHEEYGMDLDIYAFDAGAIDGKRFYGNIYSDRFKGQFPNGFDPIYKKAKEIGTRLGVWGGPDGFGDTPEEEQARIDQMVKLCKEYEFALFKFDAVCGPLRPENEDAFIRMMTLCRDHSPDLILLNHRLGLEKAQAYATTFLWEGWETYIDVFMNNAVTAPHHRAGALSRGLPPDLQRLTEDHGVCISSCIDYWDDDLVLQAFNRNLILAPQVYGSPWLMRDDEFPKFARIYNLHRKYREIMVNGLVLPEDKYGPHAVSRGDENTRLITLRNLTWEEVQYNVTVGDELGLGNSEKFEVRQYHPTEKVIGTFTIGDEIEVMVSPFRSCLLIITSKENDEPAVTGAAFRVLKNVENKPIEIEILGMPGSKIEFDLADYEKYTKAILDGKELDKLINGKTVKVILPGDQLSASPHRKIADMNVIEMITDEEWKSMYEATVYSADNNALEVRSHYRSGPSTIPVVQKAQEAFFHQEVFTERGIWDRNLFDGDMETGFWPSRKYNQDQKVMGGCFRLDLGVEVDIDQLVIHVPDEYSLQPMLNDEGNRVDVSNDLVNWETLTYLAGKIMTIDIGKPIRFLRFRAFPDRIVEIEGFYNDEPLERSNWRASNLFAYPDRRFSCNKVWKAQFTLDEIPKNSYLCVAINGKHGTEGAYAAARIGGKLVGAPDRATSYPSNTWEYINARSDKNYTYYIPLTKEYLNQDIEVFVMGFNEEYLDLDPEVWISAYPFPYEKATLELVRK